MSVPDKDARVVHLPGAEVHTPSDRQDAAVPGELAGVIGWIRQKFGWFVSLLAVLVATGVAAGVTAWQRKGAASENIAPSTQQEEAQAPEDGDQPWVDVMAGVGSSNTLQPYEVGVNATGVLVRSASPLSCKLVVRHRDFFGADGGSAPMEIQFSVRTYGSEPSKLDVFFSPQAASRLRIEGRRPTRMQVRWDCPDAA